MGWPSYNHPPGSKCASTMLVSGLLSSIFQIHQTSIKNLDGDLQQSLNQLHQSIPIWLNMHVPPILAFTVFTSVRPDVPRPRPWLNAPKVGEDVKAKIRQQSTFRTLRSPDGMHGMAS